jgi:hypothetical protein
MEQAVVRIDGKLAEEVRTYCRITGLPITQVLNEAISQWLEVPAITKLSILHEDIKRRGPKAKLNMRELELLARYEAQDPDGDKNVYHLHNDEPVPLVWRLPAQLDRVVAGEENQVRQKKARVIKQVRAEHANDRQKERAAQPGEFQTRVVK